MTENFIPRKIDEDKIANLDEFLCHCEACGGNWTAMFGSGIKVLWPNEYDELPDPFYYSDVIKVIKLHIGELI